MRRIRANVSQGCALCADPHPGNLLATTSGDLVYLDFGMMSEAPQSARYAIIQHVVHLVNRDYAVSLLHFQCLVDRW